MQNNMKIDIIGAGPTGSLLAIGLSNAGAQVYIHDINEADQIINRSRVYALTNSTKDLFIRLGIWDDLRNHLNPFHKLIIRDDLLSQDVSFLPRDLPRALPKQNELGWIIEHKNLMRFLIMKLDRMKGINCELGQATDSINSDSDFVIAADGSNSGSRKIWGIKSNGWIYRQSCLTTKILIRGADSRTAYEIFRDEGPLAILPLGGSKFQIIWSAPNKICLERSDLDSPQFLDRLACVLPYELEPDMLLSKPKIFPTACLISNTFAQGKKILVGESGHMCHPVGGQGLNLCLRDVHEIISLIKIYKTKYHEKEIITHRYNRNRIFDVYFVCFLTDFLVKFYSNKHVVLFPTRFLIMWLMKRNRALRRLILRIMSWGILTQKRIRVTI